MSQFKSEIARNNEEIPDARRLSVRIAVSLVLAIFAYLGLLLGGNVVLAPDSRANNALSAPSRESQPLQLTAREAVRGLLATERQVAQKQTLHHSDSAALPPVAHLELAEWQASALADIADILIKSPAPASNQPRAPPAA